MSFSFGSLLSIGGMIVGGIVGSLIYPGVGTSIGIALGGALGGIAGMALFPEQQRSNRTPPPQPRENRQQISTYGAPIPITYGTVRLAGNIIYMSDVKETLSVYKYRVEGQRVRDYTRLYTATFAVAFCEGPVTGIARIWINGKLFVDFRDPDGPYYPSGSVSLAQGNIDTSLARKEVYFSIHWGEEDQDPDATLAALLGSGNVPAYRGLFYIVFPDFPVGEFGGVPTIEVEIGAINEIVEEAANPNALPPATTFSHYSYADWSEIDTFGHLEYGATWIAIRNAGDLCNAWIYKFLTSPLTNKEYRTSFNILSIDTSSYTSQNCTILALWDTTRSYRVIVWVEVRESSFNVFLYVEGTTVTKAYTGITSYPRSKLLHLDFPGQETVRLRIYNSSYSENPDGELEVPFPGIGASIDYLSAGTVYSNYDGRASLSIDVGALYISD